MKYKHLNNHRGEILRPGTLIQIIDPEDIWSRKGSIFRIIEHIVNDRYSFKVVKTKGPNKIGWDFNWEFDYAPMCTILKTEKAPIENDPEYEGLFI